MEKAHSDLIFPETKDPDQMEKLWWLTKMKKIKEETERNSSGIFGGGKHSALATSGPGNN